MKVLLSIRPEFAEDILNGNKIFEYRKSIFKSPDISNILVYATKPISQVIGEFYIDRILKHDVKSLWNLTYYGSGISEEYFYHYFRGQYFGYAIKAAQPYRYKKPLDIGEVSHQSRPPQSFMYVS